MSASVAGIVAVASPLGELAYRERGLGVFQPVEIVHDHTISDLPLPVAAFETIDVAPAEVDDRVLRDELGVYIRLDMRHVVSNEVDRRIADRVLRRPPPVALTRDRVVDEARSRPVVRPVGGMGIRVEHRAQQIGVDSVDGAAIVGEAPANGTFVEQSLQFGFRTQDCAGR